ncbi:MinD/ParA family protein [Halobacillus naozhouensis]|uniref:MinD/ParA family protein n=1 Tax=Halobacillus naozhouensis TaxID=554880 RepID=A0ABY8J2N8_9BACI|nr:MinD/ParA family protein [Halobacillus naozhouensis]WFT76755.1 MinD/ParA family protein [Halobacillus naozhouensis]
MADQAEQLRSRLLHKMKPSRASIIAIASGKGGVGKTNFTINFALKLIEEGKKVLIFDLDIGMGNVDILLGVTPRYSVVDLLQYQASLDNIVEFGPKNLAYIAGGSGLSTLYQMSESGFHYFQQAFEQLADEYDMILFDMGVGATEDSLNFISSADEAVIVTTPEPTSITDAYAMIKHLKKRNHALPVHLLVNRTLSERSGLETFLRLEATVKKFIGMELLHLGSIPDDRSVVKAVINQLPFVLEEPRCQASRAVGKITEQYLAAKGLLNERKTENFLSKLKRLVVK